MKNAKLQKETREGIVPISLYVTNMCDSRDVAIPVGPDPIHLSRALAGILTGVRSHLFKMSETECGKTATGGTDRGWTRLRWRRSPEIARGGSRITPRPSSLSAASGANLLADNGDDDINENFTGVPLTHDYAPEVLLMLAENSARWEEAGLSLNWRGAEILSRVRGNLPQLKLLRIGSPELDAFETAPLLTEVRVRSVEFPVIRWSQVEILEIWGLRTHYGALSVLPRRSMLIELFIMLNGNLTLTS
ncbi:hypothetical protein B0H14DRAFT_2617992 [Mycena olivaceomarginata]|nr:hypothetical protein B0H14DRAFT_2617992 [Mycena olivaceomarginata]